MTRVRVHGRSGKAHVRVDLDNGEWIELDPVGSYSSPAKMNFEIAAQAGSKPALKALDVQEVVTLLYWLGDHSEAIKTADRAWELGAEYLREATLGDVQMGDQASRWQAFCQLNGGDVRHDTVLRQIFDTGSRYVRTQWLMEYLRVRARRRRGGQDGHPRLERFGWKRAGTEGRVKATDPELPEVAPVGVLDRAERLGAAVSPSQVTAGNGFLRAREASLSRAYIYVPAVTWRKTPASSDPGNGTSGSGDAVTCLCLAGRRDR